MKARKRKPLADVTLASLVEIALTLKAVQSELRDLGCEVRMLKSLLGSPASPLPTRPFEEVVEDALKDPQFLDSMAAALAPSPADVGEGRRSGRRLHGQFAPSIQSQ